MNTASSSRVESSIDIICCIPAPSLNYEHHWFPTRCTSWSCMSTSKYNKNHYALMFRENEGWFATCDIIRRVGDVAVLHVEMLSYHNFDFVLFFIPYGDELLYSVRLPCSMFCCRAFLYQMYSNSLGASCPNFVRSNSLLYGSKQKISDWGLRGNAKIFRRIAVQIVVGTVPIRCSVVIMWRGISSSFILRSLIFSYLLVSGHVSPGTSKQPSRITPIYASR